MFFKDRSSDWLAPKIPTAIGIVLLITVLGVFYFGIFGNSTIKSFINTQPTANAQLK
jgi:choline-glycine betaine transporter